MPSNLARDFTWISLQFKQLPAASSRYGKADVFVQVRLKYVKQTINTIVFSVDSIISLHHLLLQWFNCTKFQKKIFLVVRIHIF